MKIRLRRKPNEDNKPEVHIDLYKVTFKPGTHFCTGTYTFLSIPTGIKDHSVKTTAVGCAYDVPLIYKGKKLNNEEFCFQTIKDHPLLGHLCNTPIDLDNLQSGYIDKYKLPFYYDSDKEQVVDENQFKIWLQLNEDNLLIMSDRLAYYLGDK